MAPSERSSAMAEILASAGQEAKFKNGSIIEGTVSAIKGDDVFVDIGYKSEGSVSLGEFGEAGVKVGDKVSVMLVKLEDDKTGMVEMVAFCDADYSMREKAQMALIRDGIDFDMYSVPF